MTQISSIHHKQTIFFRTNKTLFVDIYTNSVFVYHILLAIYVLLALINELLVFLDIAFFGVRSVGNASGFLLLSDLLSEFLHIFLYEYNNFFVILFAGLIGGWVYSRLLSTILVFIFVNRYPKTKFFPNFYQYNAEKLPKVESSFTNKIIKLLTYPVLFVFIIASVLAPFIILTPVLSFSSRGISNFFIGYFTIIFLSLFIFLYFDRSFILIRLSPSKIAIQFPSFKDPKVGIKSPLSYSIVYNAHCPQCNKILTTKFIEKCPFCKTNLKGIVCPFCLLTLTTKSNTSSCPSCNAIFHKEEFKTHISIYKKCPICSNEIIS